MNDDRFEAWWPRNPARLALGPASKELARSIWRAAQADFLDEIVMCGEITNQSEFTLTVSKDRQGVGHPLAVPEGWVVVPKEPTQEMCSAGYAANEKWPSERCDNQREWCYSVSQPRWAAMIKAAPPVPLVAPADKGAPC